MPPNTGSWAHTNAQYQQFNQYNRRIARGVALRRETKKILPKVPQNQCANVSSSDPVETDNIDALAQYHLNQTNQEQRMLEEQSKFITAELERLQTVPKSTNAANASNPSVINARRAARLFLESTAEYFHESELNGLKSKESINRVPEPEMLRADNPQQVDEMCEVLADTSKFALEAGEWPVGEVYAAARGLWLANKSRSERLAHLGDLNQSHQDHLDAQRSLNEKLQDQLASAGSRAETAESALAEAMQQIGRLVKEHDSLLEQRESEWNAERENLTAAVEIRGEEDIARLKRAEDNLESARNANRLLQLEKRNQIEVHLQEQQSWIARESKDLGTKDQQIKDLQGKYGKSVLKIANIRELLATSEDKAKSADKRVAGLQQNVQSLEERNLAVELEMTLIQESMKVAESEHRDAMTLVHADLLDTKEQLRQTTENLNQSRMSNSELDGQYLTLFAENQFNQDGLLESKQEVLQLREDLRQLEEQNAQTESGNDSLRTRVSNLESRVANLKSHRMALLGFVTSLIGVDRPPQQLVESAMQALSAADGLNLRAIPENVIISDDDESTSWNAVMSNEKSLEDYPLCENLPEWLWLATCLRREQFSTAMKILERLAQHVASTRVPYGEYDSWFLEQASDELGNAIEWNMNKNVYPAQTLLLGCMTAMRCLELRIRLHRHRSMPLDLACIASHRRRLEDLSSHLPRDNLFNSLNQWVLDMHQLGSSDKSPLARLMDLPDSECERVRFNPGYLPSPPDDRAIFHENERFFVVNPGTGQIRYYWKDEMVVSRHSDECSLVTVISFFKSGCNGIRTKSEDDFLILRSWRVVGWLRRYLDQ